VSNKIGRDTKHLITDFVQEKMIEMWQIWPKLTPREKALLLTSLDPFVVAKLQAVAVTGEVNFKELPESQLDQIALKLHSLTNKK
jgi:hypothetical protein